MEPAARMFISSSYWSDNIGLVAALTTIRELKRRDSEIALRATGEKLRTAINNALAEAGLAGNCAGLSSNPYVALDLPAGVDGRKVSTLFIQEMARRGVHTYMSFKATLAHTDADIAQTAAAATAAFKVIKAGLDQGNLDTLLIADVKKEPFRRQVR
jgi:glutamate-1-semialdehyde aminotransferase